MWVLGILVYFSLSSSPSTLFSRFHLDLEIRGKHIYSCHNRLLYSCYNDRIWFFHLCYCFVFCFIFILETKIRQKQLEFVGPLTFIIMRFDYIRCIGKLKISIALYRLVVLCKKKFWFVFALKLQNQWISLQFQFLS